MFEGAAVMLALGVGLVLEEKLSKHYFLPFERNSCCMWIYWFLRSEFWLFAKSEGQSCSGSGTSSLICTLQSSSTHETLAHSLYWSPHYSDYVTGKADSEPALRAEIVNLTWVCRLSASVTWHMDYLGSHETGLRQFTIKDRFQKGSTAL